jgi:hypothetical protein
MVYANIATTFSKEQAKINKAKFTSAGCSTAAIHHIRDRTQRTCKWKWFYWFPHRKECLAGRY